MFHLLHADVITELFRARVKRAELDCQRKWLDYMVFEGFI